MFLKAINPPKIEENRHRDVNDQILRENSDRKDKDHRIIKDLIIISMEMLIGKHCSISDTVGERWSEGKIICKRVLMVGSRKGSDQKVGMGLLEEMKKLSEAI